MKFKVTFYAALALLFSAASLAAVAQQTPSSTGVPVRMLVTVEARHGSSVPVINREDVMVHQGHDRAKVTDWVPAQGDHSDLELVILIDDSSDTSFDTQLEDIRRFILAQPATAKVGIAYMQNGTAKVVQDLTSDHTQAAKALRLPMGRLGASASPYFSLGDLIKHWPEGAARREVLMISNGIDLYWGSGPDDPYVDSVIEQAQRAGIIAFAIYAPGLGHFGHSSWRTWWGQMYLSRVADETGGESYYMGFQGPAVAFTPYLENVQQRLTHQYWLTFLAKPQKKAGMERVKLMTEVPNAELVSADKVYVPAAP
ncbi:MAG TPA: hypothetical protein VMT05_09830 [Terriglobales bacterium]|jgi:hypothetical protein|nr:hypothetical protein [Terriglobales bacterium]